MVRTHFFGIVSWTITGSVIIAVVCRQVFNMYLVRSSMVIRFFFQVQIHCIRFSFFWLVMNGIIDVDTSCYSVESVQGQSRTSTSELWDMACGRIPPPEYQHGLQRMRTASSSIQAPVRRYSMAVVHDVMNRASPYLGYCSECHRRKIGFGNGIGYCPSSICRRKTKQRSVSTTPSAAVASLAAQGSGGASSDKRTRIQ